MTDPNEHATTDEAVDDKAAAIRKKRIALEEARAALLAERVARETATQDELAIADMAVLEKLEAEHGEVGKMLGEIKTPLGLVLVKKPKYGEWRRFQDSKMKPEDRDTLVYTCVVHPPLPTFRQWARDFPALEVAVGNLIAKLAGSEMVTDLVPK